MSYKDDFLDMMSWTEKDWDNAWKFVALWNEYQKTPEFRETMRKFSKGLQNNLSQKNSMFERLKGK